MAGRGGHAALRWLGRGLLAILALALLVIAFGAGYEVWARQTARDRFPPPGKLVDVGAGRRIHIDCRGHGTPTVVLLSGLDANGALAWSAVHDQIAAFTRVCAYDRAGIMYSDPSPLTHDAKLSTSDLHAALAAAGEAGPFVLTGHSLGGPYIDHYVRTYPGEVSGLVFVDGSHPDQIKAFEAIGLNKLAANASAMEKLMRDLTWTGWTELPFVRISAPGMPARAAANAQAFLAPSLPAVLQELDALSATLAEGGTLRDLGPHPLGARPTVILTALKPPPPATLKAMGMTVEQAARQRQIWTELHNDEASWSTRSRHQLVPDATHYIQFDRPDLVVSAVREVVAEVRAGPAAAPTAGR